MKQMFKMFLAAICFISLAGCSSSKNNMPDSVEVYSMLSSMSSKPITNKEDVEYLWNLYESFEYGEAVEMKDVGKDWPYDVIFTNSQTNEKVAFTIYGNGSCCFDYDIDGIKMLKDGRKIYNEFVAYGEKAIWSKE